MMILSISALVAICYAAFFAKSKRTIITYTDIAVALYLLYGMLNMVFICQTPPDSMMLYGWGLCLCVYVAIRNFIDKVSVVWAISLLGIVQVFVGMAQLCGWIQSNHSEFIITGTFSNPGPYGGFLALSLIATVWLLREGVKYRALLISIGLLIFLMLVLSDSRAAWVAALSGIGAQFVVLRRWRMKLAVCATIGLLIVGLYFYRTESANARLLIWRVCAQLIYEKPILGLGVGSLPQHYMNAQSEYFLQYPDSEFTVVSTNNYQAFNEFIHILVEQGAIGLMLFFWIIFSCRKSTFFSLILGWLTFALFSYPGDIPMLMLMLVSAFALCSSGEVARLEFNKKWLLLGGVIILFAVITLVKYHYAIASVKDASLAAFPNNRDYMLRYAKQKQDIAVFGRLTSDICSSSEILCDMGDIYRQQNQITRADSCYRLANSMVPCRIIPIHKLCLLYNQIDSVKAKHYATRIIHFNTQIVGSAVLRARADAEKMLTDD